MQPRMDIFGQTDRGRVRPHNEDSFLVAELRRSLVIQSTSLNLPADHSSLGDVLGFMLLVADGMGGHAAGENASRAVAETMFEYTRGTIPCFYRLPVLHPEDLRKELVCALEKCGERLRSDVEVYPERKGMGTTLTLAYLIWPELYVMHVGDSRCYLLRDGELTQITKDHTYAQQFIDEGLMSAEQARGSTWDNTLWNVVGSGEQHPTAELHRLTLESGDRLLLCSDGLTKHVPQAAIKERLLSHNSAAECCAELIRHANQGGGTDNITAVVARIRSEDGAGETSILSEEQAPDPYSDTVSLTEE